MSAPLHLKGLRPSLGWAYCAHPWGRVGRGPSLRLEHNFTQPETRP